jgi:hypothetical protein
MRLEQGEVHGEDVHNDIVYYLAVAQPQRA